MWPLVGGLAGVGLVLATIGGFSVWRHLSRRRSWTHGRATVVGYRWSGVGSRSVQHWNLERTAADGRTLRTTTRLGTSWGTMRKFPFDIDVLIDPANETRFVPASGCRSGAAGFFLLFWGLVLIACGGFALKVMQG